MQDMRAQGDKYLGETARAASARSEEAVAPTPTTPMRTPHVTPSPTMASAREDHEVDNLHQPVGQNKRQK